MCKLCAIAFAGALALGAASPAAGKTFTPPQGCTLYLTAQQMGCIVSNYYRCTQDAPGDQWRADFGLNGAYFVSKIDRESQWLESVDLDSGTHEVLQPGGADPASFSMLLSKGRDDFDFSTSTDTGVVTHYKGHDLMTGKSVTINGVALKQTEYAITATGPDGKVLWSSSGHEYIQPEWRIFLSGAGVRKGPEGALPYDNTPMQLIQPGQPGFAATVPEYGCHSTMSMLELPQSKRMVE